MTGWQVHPRAGNGTVRSGGQRGTGRAPSRASAVVCRSEELRSLLPHYLIPKFPLTPYLTSFRSSRGHRWFCQQVQGVFCPCLADLRSPAALRAFPSPVPFGNLGSTGVTHPSFPARFCLRNERTIAAEEPKTACLNEQNGQQGYWRRAWGEISARSNM